MNQELIIKFKSLFQIAWYASLIMIILIPVQIIIFVVYPPPSTVEGFFELYQQSLFLGLLSLDFLYIINNILILTIYLALFILLFKEKPTTILLALVLGLISNACYYPSNPAFEMLTLSNLYFQSPPDNLIAYLSAGEALLAGYTGTSFDVYYILGGISLLLFTIPLLRSPIFKNSLGIWGVLSGIFMLIPSSFGLIGMIFSLLSLIPWMVFIVLLMHVFKKITMNKSLI